jgi:hypothetical protein
MHVSLACLCRLQRTSKKMKNLVHSLRAFRFCCPSNINPNCTAEEFKAEALRERSRTRPQGLFVRLFGWLVVCLFGCLFVFVCFLKLQQNNNTF